jgi:hypothetical protein
MLHFLLNPEEAEFYDFKAFDITIGVHRSIFGIVAADNLQDALDWLIDKLEETEQDTPAYFLSDREESDLIDSGEIENFIQGGNHGRYLSFECHELHASEVTIEKIYCEVIEKS